MVEFRWHHNVVTANRYLKQNLIAVTPSEIRCHIGWIMMFGCSEVMFVRLHGFRSAHCHADQRTIIVD
ncbi:MAG: hypothetical protein CBB71_14215 [Rhodopirellula sp. TMED11]|nr:MAG: hypothetical protein CBB71_14215 [Rhodopirellula sp. TMED11]